MPRVGMMLQMDGSHHEWYGNKKSCLIGAIDDANNEIVYAEFFDSENTLDCMKVIQKIIESKGVFDILYVDKAGIFGGNKRQNFCQLEEACKKLGITIIYAHTAEAKGRIERLWGTLQGRIISEMRILGIKTKKEANNYLQNHFIPKEYSQKFLKMAATNESNYRPYVGESLMEIFCVKEYRNIRGDQTFHYDGKKYLIENFPGNLRGKLVEIRTYQDRSIKFFALERVLQVKELAQPSQTAEAS